VSKPKILHSFGREDQLDPEALERLMASIARHLDLTVPAGGDEPVGLELEPVDGRDLGGVWVLDQLWDRLGIGREIRRLARKPAHTPGRKLDVALLERILFALVAGRALAPSSKLEATRWIREETYIPGLAEVDHTACYRAMDWLLEHLPALQETVFFAVADLLQLDVDVIFFDTTSTYFETEFADGELDGTENGLRQRGHSKDLPSHCVVSHSGVANSPGCSRSTWIRRPSRLPRRTCTASSSPRWTRCNTVCRATPRIVAA
jgi:hypothetical protein